MKNEYLKQAEKFLSETSTSLKCKFVKNDFHFVGDKDKRDVYKITLSRGGRKFSFNFGQSIAKSLKYVDMVTKNEFTPIGNPLKGNVRVINPSYLMHHCNEVKGTPPTSYDVLACLTKYDPIDFENFCSEFGYDTDSRTAKKTFKAVKKEFAMVQAIWNDKEIEQLREIQ